MKVKILTLGCKVNQFESQAMFRMLSDNGYTVVGEEDIADIAILNSCAVTKVSEQKAVKLIHRLRRENPLSVIVLTGCMAQTMTNASNRLPEVDIVLGNKRRSDLITVLEQYFTEQQRLTFIEPYAKKDDYEPLYVDDFLHRTRAFLNQYDEDYVLEIHLFAVRRVVVRHDPPRAQPVRPHVDPFDLVHLPFLLRSGAFQQE